MAKDNLQENAERNRFTQPIEEEGEEPEENKEEDSFKQDDMY